MGNKLEFHDVKYWTTVMLGIKGESFTFFSETFENLETQLKEFEDSLKYAYVVDTESNKMVMTFAPESDEYAQDFFKSRFYHANKPNQQHEEEIVCIRLAY